MIFALLPEIREPIAECLPSFRHLVCVDHGWRFVVLLVVERLREDFRRQPFDMAWLDAAWGSPLFAGWPRSETVEVRLQRVLNANRVRDVITAQGLWWYKLQIYLHEFCDSYARDTRLPRVTPRTWADIFDLCYQNSACSGYSSRELFPGRFRMAHRSHILHESFFRYNHFVEARNLGCTVLDGTVEEVLGTLECMLCRDQYCDVYCSPTQCWIAGDDLRQYWRVANHVRRGNPGHPRGNSMRPNPNRYWQDA